MNGITLAEDLQRSRKADDETMAKYHLFKGDDAGTKMDEITLQAQREIAYLRMKRDVGKKLSPKEVAVLVRADQDDATARAVAQTQAATAALQQANYELQRQADEMAYRQRLAGCKAAADLVALSINNFWGGIAAGLATGAACMN